MPNPIKYKSVGVSIDAYDKLVYIADKEDRAIGRQLSRMIDDAYEEVVARVIYSPNKPLDCGAKCWIETFNNVIVT